MEASKRVNNWPESFEELWKSWYAKIYNYSKSFVSLRAEDREEVVSDILVQAWDRRLRYDSRWSWSTWLYRLARNMLIDKNRRLLRLQDRVTACDDIDRYADECFVSNPAHNVLQDARRQGVTTALAGLSLQDRELLYLIYAADLSYAEAGRIQGIPEGTAKSRASRLRIRLARELEEWI
jgi:RNA polymerase sigma-70 factor (ECF subfamily)